MGVNGADGHLAFIFKLISEFKSILKHKQQKVEQIHICGFKNFILRTEIINLVSTVDKIKGIAGIICNGRHARGDFEMLVERLTRLYKS